MDLLDRYLGAVSALLPRAQREDIIAELRDILLNRIEEKEAGLGRPLTEAEREAVLKDYGHPVAVAGRYDAHQQLIGPKIYPYYVFALKAGLAIAAAVSLITAVAFALAHGEAIAGMFPRAITSFVNAAVMLTGVFTIVAVAIERWGLRLPFLEDWRPRDLPSLSGSAGSRPDWLVFGWRFGLPHRSGGGKSVGNSLFELAANVLFILWWTGLLHLPVDTFGGREASVLPAQIWTTLHDLILAAVLAQTAVCVLDIVRPSWVRIRAAALIAANVFSLYVLWLLWESGPLFDVQVHALGAAEAAKMELSIGWTLQICILVCAAIWVGQSLMALVRFARGSARRNGDGLAPAAS
jgi:hypothetical protein